MQFTRPKSTSGLTAKATTTDAVVELIAATTERIFHSARITNEGTTPGFWSIDGGTTWERVAPQSSYTDEGVEINNKAIQIKRVASGDDMTGVFGSAW